MFRSAFPASLAFTVAATALVLTTSTAHAQQTVVVAPGNTAPARAEERSETVGPNTTLITTGIVTFGVPYIASAIVAAESNHQGDGHLWVPVLGPWLDLGDRGGCPASSTNCDAETTNKVLLVADGVLQGAGALQILAGFIFPEKRVVIAETALTPKMTLTPTRLARGAYGLAAVGEF